MPRGHPFRRHELAKQVVGLGSLECDRVQAAGLIPPQQGRQQPRAKAAVRVVQDRPYRRRVAWPRPPGLPDLAHDRRIHDQVPERPDRGHVCARQSVRLDVDGHLGAVTTVPVGNPADVYDAMHGPVDDLRRPLVTIRYSEENGSASNSGPDGPSRRSAATGRAASAPSDPCPPSGRPSRAAPRASTWIAHSVRAEREDPRRVPRGDRLHQATSRPGRPASATPRRPPAGSRGSARGSARVGRCARCPGASFRPPSRRTP